MYRGLPSRKAPWTKRTGLGGRITPMRTNSFSPICQHSHGRITSRSISGSLCSVAERSKAAQITRQRPALLICIIKRVSYNIAHCTWRSGLSCCIAYTPAYVPRPPVVHSVCDVNTHTHTIRPEEISVPDGQKLYSAKETKDCCIYRSVPPSVIRIPILRSFALM